MAEPTKRAILVSAPQVLLCLHVGTYWVVFLWNPTFWMHVISSRVISEPPVWGGLEEHKCFNPLPQYCCLVSFQSAHGIYWGHCWETWKWKRHCGGCQTYGSEELVTQPNTKCSVLLKQVFCWPHISFWAATKLALQRSSSALSQISLYNKLVDFLMSCLGYVEAGK